MFTSSISCKIALQLQSRIKKLLEVRQSTMSFLCKVAITFLVMAIAHEHGIDAYSFRKNIVLYCLRFPDTYKVLKL